MDLEKIKKYLQSYLDTILTPRYNKKRAELGFNPMEFNVSEILEENHQPPTIHIFLNTKPEIKKGRSLKPHASLTIIRVEKDISDFLKMFSIDFPIKVHWNEK